jgi:hypothetical protein
MVGRQGATFFKDHNRAPNDLGRNEETNRENKKKRGNQETVAFGSATLRVEVVVRGFGATSKRGTVPVHFAGGGRCPGDCRGLLSPLLFVPDKRAPWTKGQMEKRRKMRATRSTPSFRNWID